MKTKPKKTTIGQHKKAVFVTLLVVIAVIIGSIAVTYRLVQNNQQTNQNSISNVRDMVLLSVRAVKKDAPVDARTGDIYFPESKLYLPNPSIPLGITYLQDNGDISNSQSQLSVSTYPVRGTESLYTANNMKELYAAVPHLQSCSRGIKVVKTPFPASDTQNILKHEVTLSGNSKAYIYIEKDCPELNTVADLFVSLKSY